MGWSRPTVVAVCRAVLLMTKRDLADLCQEGLLESIEGQQQDRLAALLQVKLHAYVLDDCLNAN